MRSRGHELAPRRTTGVVGFLVAAAPRERAPGRAVMIANMPGIDERFSRAAFLAAVDPDGLAAELAAVLSARIVGSPTPDEEMRIIEDLRAIGHPLSSFDDRGEGGAWCDDWHTRRADGDMVLTIAYGYPPKTGVDIEFSKQHK